LQKETQLPSCRHFLAARKGEVTLENDSFVSGVYPKGTYSFEELLQIVRQGDYLSECGAIASFIGIVRNESSPENNETNLTNLLIESNKEMANSAIQAICADLTQGEVKKVIICHMEGEFYVGEDLVYVIVAGGHRHEVFATLQEAVERYKSAAAIWKKEVYSDETARWVH
jgi:molybdopterin synthase catalytic subunit